MSIVFEPAAPAAPPDAQRADVACFVGFVGRRAGRPLPDALRAQLDAGGWVSGPWARPAAQVEALLNLPLVLDSWHLFDRFYAWDERPLDTPETPDPLDPIDPGRTAPRRCASYLGAAVRSFFARGGKRAIVIRVGDPWPYLEDSAARAAQRTARLALLLPTTDPAADPFAPHDPSTWQGLQHLHGLPDDSLLVLPDLPDVLAIVPPPPDPDRPPAPQPEGFVPCDVEAPPPRDRSILRVPAPRLDDAAFARWRQVLRDVREFLDRRQRTTMLVAALPLPLAGSQAAKGLHAQADARAWLEQTQILRSAFDEDTQPGRRPAEALSQLAWPWLRTRAARGDLPQGLEPPDGVLAGLVAQGAIARGTFRSVAGDASLPLLRDLGGAEPMPAWGLGDDSPTGRLAQRVCLFAPGADGWALQSDVSTSALDPWRFGGATRLIGTLLRAARRAGDGAVFEPNGPRLWAHLRGTLEDLLAGFWREGAFSGAAMSDAFEVICDRTTMTQNDLDTGRLIAHVRVRPAMSIERITVVLQLGQATGSSLTGASASATPFLPEAA